VKALQYIQENYGNPIACEDIAGFLQYSASYVRYIFRKEGDTSVQAKINEVRLQNAKRLLRSTDMSITEVAYAVGFSDSNYFSSFFKKQTGKTPRQYRHQN
jgi:AraC-like DNA-binding protein